MVSKKQAIAAIALITIAVTTIAWAQATMGIITLTPANYNPTVAVSTPAFEITADSKGTAPENGTLTVDNVHFNYTTVKVSLVDLGGLYQSMKSLTVSFINTTGNTQYAVLTLNNPDAEFFYNSTSVTKADSFTVNFVVSWVAESTVTPQIRFAVTSEVVGTYDYKTA